MRIRQPIDKKTLTDRGTFLCVLKFFKVEGYHNFHFWHLDTYKVHILA